MPKISRRVVLVGFISAPVAASNSPSVAAPPATVAAAATSNSTSDDLIARAASWIATDARMTAMQLKWQEHERLLFDKAKRMKMGCGKATRSNMPEAKAMRALNVEIDETFRQLEASAEEISLIPATTIDAAIAKIELGIKVQGPFEWRPSAGELLEDGLAELQVMIRDARRFEPSSFR